MAVTSVTMVTTESIFFPVVINPLYLKDLRLVVDFLRALLKA